MIVDLCDLLVKMQNTELGYQDMYSRKGWAGNTLMQQSVVYHNQ